VRLWMGSMLVPSGPLMGRQVVDMWEVGALHRHLVFHRNPMRLGDTRHMTDILGPPFLSHVVTVPNQTCCVVLVTCPNDSLEKAQVTPIERSRLISSCDVIHTVVNSTMGPALRRYT
jgi:hypothetical protein